MIPIRIITKPQISFCVGEFSKSEDCNSCPVLSDWTVSGCVCVLINGVSDPVKTLTRECVFEDTEEPATGLCTGDLSSTESCVKTCEDIIGQSWSEWSAFGDCKCDEEARVSERVCETADKVQVDNRQAMQSFI